jgi:ribosomal protein S12 methylthiotransferase
LDLILKSMRRGMSSRALIELIAAIRERVPGITLRSTLIVGYPGEGVREFEELMQFVRETRFDRLGVFSYSPEVDTPAFSLGDPVSQRVKQQRMAMVMEAQKEISQDRNSALIGSTQTVLIDRVEGGSYVGRTEGDAPEIDNEVFFAAAQPLAVGTFCRVEILDGYEYDLYGRAS